MDSKDIIDAAQNRKPVVYNGIVYKEILEYILWFNHRREKQRSVVLLDMNGSSTVRALASEIKLAES